MSLIVLASVVAVVALGDERLTTADAVLVVVTVAPCLIVDLLILFGPRD
ncbi:hypothetical protein GCM10023321_14620 [Pseudonocardia eucalypti]|uniref:Uncharacterized protein n=1 Tax=Pseudonocardia eucalypti TaxID=648755 RepID=A0ABP9PPB9_9PSEU|nr:hypothetical protein [Pseudonocardia eucalypti]